MSYHRIVYWIYPEDDKSLPQDDWERADIWINGMAYKHDKGEAFALARLARLSTQFPIVVVEVPVGSKRPSELNCWEF